MKAYEVIATPDKWTKGEYARTAKGNAIGATEENACKWCMEGAITKAYVSFSDWMHIWNQADDICLEKTGYNMHEYNDMPETTHADVYKLLKEMDI